MHNELLKIGPLTIYWYGFMLAIAVCVGLYLLSQEASRQGYSKDTFSDLGIVIVLSGLIGARLLYVLLNIKSYIQNPGEIIMLHRGGLAILGSFLLAPVAAFIFIRKKKLSFLKTGDLIVPFIALSHAIGRIGCFFNGCCYGVASVCGIYFPVHDAVLLPTQLISSLLLLILYFWLRFKQLQPHIAGSILVQYVMYYSLIRFLVEFIRNDSMRIAFGLTFFQYLCIIFFFLGLISNIVLKWKSKTSQ